MADKYTALLVMLKEATGTFSVDEADKLAGRLYSGDDEDEKYWLLFLALQSGHQAPGAALALVEMTLPGWFWWIGHLDQTDRRIVATIAEKAYPDTPNHQGFAYTAYLAILIAWCEAMIAKETSE